MVFILSRYRANAFWGRLGSQKLKISLIRFDLSVIIWSVAAPLNGDQLPGSSNSGGNTAGIDEYRLEEVASTTVSGTIALRIDACRCTVCFRRFGDRWKLERHSRIHTGERPFTCERCGKSFITKEHLVRHEMSHAGRKPYSCSLCGKAFTRKDHVDRHFKKTHCRPKYTDL